MPRRTKDVTVTEPGRDKGKTFRLIEMPADQGERWANRALLLLINADAEVPEGLLNMGASGLALAAPMMIAVGLRAMRGLRYSAELDDLLAEMMQFVKFIPPGGGAYPAQDIFPGENSQIEEIRTFWDLRLSYVELLLGFSLAGILSNTDSPPAAPPAS